MMNRHVHLALKAWTRRRPGRLLGFIATVCLTGAALLALAQALGVHSRLRQSSRGGDEFPYTSRSETDRRSAEDRWRVGVSRKLEEILVRVPGATTTTEPSVD